MSSAWLGKSMSKMTMESVHVPREAWEKIRHIRVGICKCGHMWILHFHFGNPARPGTSCDEYKCKCKAYRFRRLRQLGPRRSAR